MRQVVFSLFFLSISSLALAEDCLGYIIKNGVDTVKGTLDIPIYKRAINLKKEIMFADMWQMVKFSEGTAKPKKMNAGDIAGFGFEHLGEWYHYEVLDLQKNYGMKAPKFMGKFVNDFRFFVWRVNEGQLPIYREYWNSETKQESTNHSTGRTIIMYGKEVNLNLWIKNNEGTFVEISPTAIVGGRKKCKEFLEKQLKLEDDFLKTVDEKAKFEDAEEILIRYNIWKKNNG